MRSFKAIIAVFAAGGLAATPALAKPVTYRAPAGALVMVELAKPLSTQTQTAGDTFPIRLAEPLVVKGRIVLKAGTPGVGEVVEASKPGLGGKPAKFVLAAKYLDYNGKHIPLKALQLSGAGQGHAGAANALGIGGIAFAPLGLAAFVIRGGDVAFPEGTQATAKLASSASLPALGVAAKGETLVARASSELPPGAIDLPAPKPGTAQVVFFRPKTVLGTGQWFNVRENGKALGKLTNGDYFVVSATPGLHTYTAKTEPEFNDQLKLQLDAGETYFVEGVLTKGVVIGAADLQPSDHAAFNLASKGLKLAVADPDVKAAQAN
jgi:hypothetical protein